MKQGLIPVKVNKKALAATDIYTYELVDLNGEKLPRFTAGAHIDVHIRDGLVRQYSLCNDPGESDRYEIGVLRDPASRGGSVAMHDEINEGDLIQISEPRNHFALAHDAKQSLLFAGGIGVTPILCMAERLSRIGSNFEMHYCTRSPDRAAFVDRIQTSNFSDRVSFHYDDGADEQKLDIKTVLGQPAEGKHLYVCGPTGFLEFVRNSAKDAGYSDDQVHFEYFNVAVEESQSTDTFTIKIASTGKTYEIGPDESIIDVLAADGVEIPVSCEQGVCGTCLTHVLEGEPEHLDHFLTDDERADNDQFTPCCSRSKSKLLVLDL